MSKKFASLSVNLSSSFDLTDGLSKSSSGITSINFNGPESVNTDITNSLDNLNKLASNTTKYTTVDIAQQEASVLGDSGTFMTSDIEKSFLLSPYPVDRFGSNITDWRESLTFGDTTVVINLRRGTGHGARLKFTHPADMTVICFVHSNPLGNEAFCPPYTWTATETIVQVPAQADGVNSPVDRVVISFLTKPKSI